MPGSDQRCVAGAVAAASRTLADLLWPPRCGGCDLPGPLLCEKCAAALPRIDVTDACPRCGAPDGSRGCAECGGREFAFAGARCGGSFEPPLSRLVTLHKDAGELRLTAVLAHLLRTASGDWTDWAKAVVAVPASPAAVRRRGFDHGALLGAAFAAESGVPALEALSARSRQDQRGLGALARARNARSAITPVPGVAVPPRVLAIDDVFTTGATLDAAASALLDAGAREVRVLAVARACGGRL